MDESILMLLALTGVNKKILIIFAIVNKIIIIIIAMIIIMIIIIIIIIITDFKIGQFENVSFTSVNMVKFQLLTRYGGSHLTILLRKFRYSATSKLS